MKKTLPLIVTVLFIACAQPTDIGRFLQSEQVQNVIDRDRQRCQCAGDLYNCCQEEES